MLDALQWQITKLSNGFYTLKNLDAGNFAYVDDDASVGTKVVGSSSKREFAIVGTGVTDEFTYACRLSTIWPLVDQET